MQKLVVQPGAVIDGFTVGELVHSGGMATLWSVTRPDIAAPLLMKIPRVSEGEDPAAIVSFEMEMMILPRLQGPHVPACFATGDFTRQAYVVIELIPGQTLYLRLPELPLPYEEARLLAEAQFAFAQLGVACGQFLIERGQFFVGGFQFFIGGFEFLVEALQFLVGGLHFLVGRLQFFNGSVVFLLERIQMIARGGKFLLHLQELTGISGAAAAFFERGD